MRTTIIKSLILTILFSFGITNAIYAYNSCPLIVAAPNVDANGVITPLFSQSCGISNCFAYAVRSDGVLMGWGSSSDSGLGDGTPYTSFVPIQISGFLGKKIISVSSGFNNRFVVLDDGSVWGWGQDSAYGLGDGLSAPPLPETHRRLPVQIGKGILPPIKSVIAGTFTNFAVGRDGTVWGWGINNNFNNQVKLIDPSIAAGSTVLVPKQIPFPSGVSITQLSLGGPYVMALSSTGDVYVWGSNLGGVIGDGATFNSNPQQADILTPTKVLSISGIKKIQALGNSAFAMKPDGSLWAWGINGNPSPSMVNILSTLGLGLTGLSHLRVLTPTEVTGVGVIKDITGVAGAGFALKPDGTVLCWGNNGNGQLGLGSSAPIATSVPAPIPGLSNVVALSSSIQSATAFAEKSDGTLVSWGSNVSGQLGNGTFPGEVFPKAVNNLSNLPDIGPGIPAIKAISAAGNYQMVLMGNGTVMAWGQNANGELGQGNLIPQYSALAVKAGDYPSVSGLLGDDPNNPIIAIDARGPVALDSHGNVYAWGANNSFQLAFGTLQNNIVLPANSSTPVKIKGPGGSNIPGFTGNIKAIAATNGFTLALDNDKHVWAWGSNSNGQLGIGTPNASLKQMTPTQVLNSTGLAVLSDVTAIWAGGAPASFVTIGADNALLAFGSNIGNRIVINQPSLSQANLPVPVVDTDGTSPLTHVISVFNGADTLILKDDGTVLYGKQIVSIPFPELDSSSGITNIAYTGSTQFYLKNDHTMEDQGSNVSGSIGDGTLTFAATPQAVPNLNDIFAISASGGVVMALQHSSSTSTIYAWGSNNLGQLGIGAPSTDNLSPSAPLQQTVYNFIGFNNPINNLGRSVFSVGDAIPLKFTLQSCAGNNISTANVTLRLFRVTDRPLGALVGTQIYSEVPVQSKGNSNLNNIFRIGNGANSDNYSYNLDTSNLAPGTYQLWAIVDDILTRPGGGTSHAVQFTLIPGSN